MNGKKFSTLWKTRRGSTPRAVVRRPLLPVLLLPAVLLPALLHAVMPQPMVIYYGQARNEYGTPYKTGADVVLRIGTNEITRTSITRSIAAGVNFVLYVPVDDGRTGRDTYVDYAAKAGDSVTIVVVDARGERPILENAVIPDVNAPGDLYPIRITTGTDLDGDGLPDEWEWELIAGLNDPAITGIEDVNPNDDADGDGATNWEEYIAGTIPYLGNDIFAAEDVKWNISDGLLSLKVLSSYGRVYQMYSAPTELAGNAYDWALCPFSLSDKGPFSIQKVEGTGGWLTFYVELTAPSRVFHLSVQ